MSENDDFLFWLIIICYIFEFYKLKRGGAHGGAPVFDVQTKLPLQKSCFLTKNSFTCALNAPPCIPKITLPPAPPP